MNRAFITGRWTKDPDTKYTKDQMCIARGTIAVDRRGKDNTADFISVVAFGKIAEHIEKYYHKGMKANICGHIQTGSYEGQNGKVYTTDVVIDEIEFGESKGQTQKSTEENEWVKVDDTTELPFN